MEEAVSGVKGELALKVFGPDLKDLEAKATEIAGVMSTVPGVADLGVFRVLGQPNVDISVDRAQADRYGINVADVQDAIQTAVGGNPVSQILLGDQRFDLVPRYQPQFRGTIDQIKNIRLLAPSGERVSLGQLCKISVDDGASMIYREANQRYIAIKYSVRGRDLGSTVEEAMNKVNREVKLPPGYTLDWAGEYESQKRANRRLATVIPITILVIVLVLYSMFRSFKWSFLVLLNLTLAPIGGLLALLITGTHFSVSTGVGFLALFGVSVQTGVIMVEHINQLRGRGLATGEAAILGAMRRLRPIMMTMLVASLVLIPAALSHGIGSDSQRPFAIVIVGGSLTAFLPIFMDSSRVGTLLLQARRPEVAAALRGYPWLAFWILALRVAVAVGLAAFLHSDSSTPILAIARNAKRIAESHRFEERVPVTLADEIGVLSSSLNAMLEEIGLRDAERAEHRSKLEQQVAERNRANAELLIAIDKAEEASRLKGEFLANMSHEIRTPMNGIIGFTQLTLSTPLNEDQRNYPDTVERSAESLMQLLNDILDVSKIEAGKVELDRAPFSADRLTSMGEVEQEVLDRGEEGWPFRRGPTPADFELLRPFGRTPSGRRRRSPPARRARRLGRSSAPALSRPRGTPGCRKR